MSSPPPLPPPPPPPPSSSYNSSLLVIVTLLAFVLIFTIIIHLILRLLARLSSSSPSPYLSHLNSTSSSSSSSSITCHLVEPNRKSLIDSLPLFTPSSLALCPSANCSICLSKFTSNDKIRLLPACRHTFHSPCIDAWLKTSPSCPLCRSVVQIQPLQREEVVSVEESVRVSWLKEYVDRLAFLSASSSFNSMRFSGSSPFGSMRFSTRGSSRRFDGEVSESLELGESFRSEESDYFASSYKWMMNAGETS